MAAKSNKKTTLEAAPIYVIAGKDNFLVNKECKAIVELLLPEEERGMGLLSVDADKIEVAEVLDELRTLPFLASRRVVLLKDADNFISNNREILEKYFENPCSTGSLIFTVGSWRSNTKLAKKLDKVGQLVSVGEIKSWDLAGFVQDYAKDKCQKKIDTAAAKLLVELVGDEPGKISSEIEKLAVFIGEDKNITQEKILELVGNNREFDIFAVINSMTAGDTASAVARLRNMFTTDKSAEFKVVGGFAFHFRKMFNARAMMDKRVPQNQIATSLRIFGDRNGFFHQLNKWSLMDISRVMQALARIDFESKTGQTTTTSAIEQLVVKACLKMARR